MGYYYSNIGNLNEYVKTELRPGTLCGQLVKDADSGGYVFWSIREFKNDAGEYRIICCDILDAQCCGWGHKPLSEDMGPYYYSCPIEYLEASDIFSEKWRSKVREYARHRKPIIPVVYNRH